MISGSVGSKKAPQIVHAEPPDNESCHEKYSQSSEKDSDFLTSSSDSSFLSSVDTHSANNSIANKSTGSFSNTSHGADVQLSNSFHIKSNNSSFSKPTAKLPSLKKSTKKQVVFGLNKNKYQNKAGSKLGNLINSNKTSTAPFLFKDLVPFPKSSPNLNNVPFGQEESKHQNALADPFPMTTESTTAEATIATLASKIQ